MEFWPKVSGLSAFSTLKPVYRSKKGFGSAGTRTRNQRLKRALLYRLSYRPVLLITLLCRASLRQPTPKAFGAALPIELPTRERVFYPSSHPDANIAGAAFIWISNRADW